MASTNIEREIFYSEWSDWRTVPVNASDDTQVEIRKEKRQMNKKKIWTGLLFVLLCTLAIGMSVFAADTTMKNKKWMSGKGGAYVDTDNDGKVDDFESSGTAYFKIKIPKQGYIIADVKTSSLPGKKEYVDMNYAEPDEESTAVKFLDSQKRELESVDNFLEDGKDISVSMAVKKGTYYVAVEGNQKYQIRYTFKAVTKVSKAGTNLKKAVSLKKGETVKNLLFLEKEQYYKIEIPNKTKITLSFNSKIRGGTLQDLNVFFYVKKGNSYYMILNKKGKVGRKVDKTGRLVSENSAAIWWSISGKKQASLQMTFPAGTYYIRAVSQGSGYYTMKWK